MKVLSQSARPATLNAAVDSTGRNVQTRMPAGDVTEAREQGGAWHADGSYTHVEGPKTLRDLCLWALLSAFLGE